MTGMAVKSRDTRVGFYS